MSAGPKNTGGPTSFGDKNVVINPSKMFDFESGNSQINTVTPMHIPEYGNISSSLIGGLEPKISAVSQIRYWNHSQVPWTESLVTGPEDEQKVALLVTLQLNSWWFLLKFNYDLVRTKARLE